MKKIFLGFMLITAINVFSQINSPNNGNLFYYNGAADVTFKYLPRGTGGRAFVHADGNVLALNFESDFTGGTRIGNDVYFKDGGNSYIYSGNFGIGTTNPKSKLTIKSGGTGVSIHPGGPPYFGTIAFNRESFNGEIFDPNGQAFQINNGGTDKHLHFQIYNGDVSQLTNNALVINGINGNVGIGTSNITSKLTVAGTIASREVKVTVDAGADFVFENDYKLPSLDSVANFIKENKHLPEIASAERMKIDGINLSEINIKLLQKIEELTLYSIQQNEELQALRKDNKVIKALLEKLSKNKNQLE